jgi:hypothetical protein
MVMSELDTLISKGVNVLPSFCIQVPSWEVINRLLRFIDIEISSSHGGEYDVQSCLMG